MAESAEQDDAMNGKNRFNEGDKVQIQMRARIVESYEDGSALVDADGTEILVTEREIL